MPRLPWFDAAYGSIRRKDRLHEAPGLGNFFGCNRAIVCVNGELQQPRADQLVYGAADARFGSFVAADQIDVEAVGEELPERAPPSRSEHVIGRLFDLDCLPA